MVFRWRGLRETQDIQVTSCAKEADVEQKVGRVGQIRKRNGKKSIRRCRASRAIDATQNIIADGLDVINATTG